jgi:hypothetical protein
VNGDWGFGFALPNLSLPAQLSWSAQEQIEEEGSGSGITLGSQHLSITSGDDTRVTAAASRYPAIDALLGSFRSLSGTPFRPACLLVRNDAPDRMGRRLDAVLGFRNAIALSAVLRARAAAINEASFTATPSDYVR